MDEDIIAIIAGFLIVFVPVAGITLRFALKPLVDSIARIMEVRAGREQTELLERRVALLEQELDRVASLAEGVAFEKRLSGESERPYRR
jgi:hypothetical protein